MAHRDKENDDLLVGKSTFFLPEDLSLPEAEHLNDEMWIQIKKNVRNVMKLNAKEQEVPKPNNGGILSGLFNSKKKVRVSGVPGPDCSKCGKKIHYAIICPYCGRVQ
jgi:hypothetical protein